MTKKTCEGPDCQREPVSKGLCMGHYQQMRKGKTLTPLKPYHLRTDAPEGYAFCTRCNTYKPIDAFWLTDRGYTRSRCRQCFREIAKEFYWRKKESV